MGVMPFQVGPPHPNRSLADRLRSDLLPLVHLPLYAGRSRSTKYCCSSADTPCCSRWPTHSRSVPRTSSLAALCRSRSSSSSATSYTQNTRGHFRGPIGSTWARVSQVWRCSTSYSVRLRVAFSSCAIFLRARASPESMVDVKLPKSYFLS